MSMVSAFADQETSASGGNGSRETTPGNAVGVVDASLNYADHVHLGAQQGHGFAAEKANHLHDKVAGKNAHLVGGDNAKNGADRIVDGAKIQTKYCRSAQESVNSAFDSGNFRYVDSKTNAPMQIEVPSDQYDAAVKLMEQKIRDGKVPGIKDVGAAKELVRKGKFTYSQAQNLAKAGTIESLTYDAVNGVILAGNAMGITASVSFAVAILNGKKWQEALDNACFEALCAGGITWVGSVLTAQIGRAGVDAALRGASDWMVRKMGTKVTNMLVSALRPGETLSNAAAKNLMSKVLRGNIVAGIVTTVVLSTDDFIILFDGKASKMQTFKNVSKTAVGVAGGVAGWMATGAAMGSVVPGIGTVIGAIAGVVGGAVGGGVSSAVASNVLDSYIEDDSKVMLRKLEAVFGQMAEDHLLTTAEASSIIKEFQQFDVPSLLRDMYASDSKEAFVKQVFNPLFDERLQLRPVIRLPTNEQVVDATAKIIEKVTNAEATGATAKEEARGAFASNNSNRTTAPDATDHESAQATAVQQPRSKKEIRDLWSIVHDYAVHLNDNSNFFTGFELNHGKGGRKVRNAITSYAHKDYQQDPWGLPVALVDTTALGFAEDGIYITEDEIYVKPSYEPRFVIRIKDIKSIDICKSGCEISINGKYYSYLHSSLTSRMEIIVKCIKKYLDQFNGTHSSAETSNTPRDTSDDLF